ncbi:Rho GTPase-activating protein 9 [Acropora cervicornis]|uniref:Rho GTPase-activating protein 9 n=1 Tax=Acropora cervicornis TaxID=6130 RepID=A0AAD9QJ23_ACRCE|nr:Rho GTPase-activating protein 9 [Acropora cervicornis]
MANGIVEALFPYSYEARDERIVSFSAGDRFTLLDKTNDDWWQVQKESEKPIYVPASYMKELIIPIYENMTSISNHPHNGEDRLREQNGRSYESLDKETDVESTVLDRNCNSDSDHNNYQGNGHVVEVFEDSNTVSRSSSGVKSSSLDVKSLANSLESTGIRPGGSFSLHKPDRPKSLSLPTGWRTMTDDMSGRPYYFNSKTGERSWKPPRNSYSKAPPSSPEARQECKLITWLTPPLGWRISQSSSSDEIVFVNDYTDEEFHHERSLSVESRGSESGSDDWPMPPTPTPTSTDRKYIDAYVCYVIVFKFSVLQGPKGSSGKPERTCTLQGASLEWVPSPSNKKKPVYQFKIKALTGVFILQHDNQIEAQYWFNEIAAVINKLVSSVCHQLVS